MQQIQFQLNGEYVELNQLLKMAGLCDSGGAGKVLVAGGGISVDGQPESRKTAKIRAGSRVSLGDVSISVTAGPSTDRIVHKAGHPIGKPS